MTHELKCLPAFFLAIAVGDKCCEIRRNDRGFEVGDDLLLREWSAETGYTGADLHVRVTHIVSAFDGLRDGYVAMSVEALSPPCLPGRVT